MRKINLLDARVVIAFCGLLLSASIFAATEANVASPVGKWKTIDVVTGRPKSIIQIREIKNHTLVGRVVKIYPRPGYDQSELCTACEGELHNQKMVGMDILTQLTVDKRHPGEWNNGKILDPVNGQTYPCYVQLLEENQRLKVRGFLGLPLFGRSQTWVRVG